MRIARGVSDLSSSASKSAPIGRPSTTMNTISADRQEARRIARAAHGAIWPPVMTMSRDPALICLPSMIPESPAPIDSLTCSGTLNFNPRSTPAWTMALANTCWEACSSEAPSVST
jgi:hypothetical protein